MSYAADIENLRISATVLFVITLAVTSYRCFSRFSKKIWGHDDSVALFSSLIFVFFVIGATLLAKASTSREQRIVGCYFMIFGFYTSVWGARISIVLTVVRVTPWRLQKKILLWVVVFFAALYLMLIIQAYWICEITFPGWKEVPGSVCIFPEAIPVTQMITTGISDGILVATPLMIIQGVHIPALRYRLFGIFSMSIATTMASVTHVILLVSQPGVIGAILGGVESAVSIVVSSMSVVIPAILRALGFRDPFKQVDTVDLVPATSIEIARTTLTMFELGLQIATITESGDNPEGGVSTVTPPKLNPAGLDTKHDQMHQVTAQTSDRSLGTSVTETVLSHPDKCDATDSLALREGPSLHTIEKDGDTDTDSEERRKG